MPKVSAFVGRSFHQDDEGVVSVFLKHFDKYKKLGFHWEDAEEAETRSVAEKVKAKLINKQVFIGIYTKRFPLSDRFVRQLNPQDVTWYSRFLWRKSNVCAPSGWTMQESGFAIGKDMKLILLVEEGVIDIGGLHGDHEIIQFSRENPEKCLPSLDAQIINLIAEPERPQEESDAESIPETPDATDSEKELRVGKPSPQELERDYFDEIFDKLFHEKDRDGARRVFDEWLSKAGSKDESVRRQATYHSLRLSAGDTDAFEELEQLTRDHPEHPSPFASLGYRLRNLGQLSLAAERLKEAAEKEFDLDRRAKLLIDASLCLAKDNEAKAGMDLLIKALLNTNDNASVAYKIYKGISQIAEITKDDDQQVIILEKALSLRPAESDSRFQLALKYSKMGKHALALYHYKILTNQASNGSNLNNLGVVYANLDLPGKAVAAYKRASQFDETLAMANLAYKFIGEGFLDEASGLVEKAMSVKDFHQNVASARARIDEVKKEEDDREEEILKRTEEERKFRLVFADASYPVAKELPPWTGKWKTPYGEIEIQTNGNVLSGNGISREVESGLRLSDILGGQTTEAPRQITKRIFLNATVQGASARGSMTVETERGSLLGSSKVEMKVQLIVLSNEISVLQTDEKGAVSFAHFTRVANE